MNDSKDSSPQKDISNIRKAAIGLGIAAAGLLGAGQAHADAPPTTPIVAEATVGASDVQNASDQDIMVATDTPPVPSSPVSEVPQVVGDTLNPGSGPVAVGDGSEPTVPTTVTQVGEPVGDLVNPDGTLTAITDPTSEQPTSTTIAPNEFVTPDLSTQLPNTGGSPFTGEELLIGGAAVIAGAAAKAASGRKEVL